MRVSLSEIVVKVAPAGQPRKSLAVTLPQIPNVEFILNGHVTVVAQRSLNTCRRLPQVTIHLPEDGP